jgi:OOP family OmpA-OmpF porin
MAFAVLLAMAAGAEAQNRAKTFYFTPFIGGYVFDGSQDLRNRLVSGLRLGYNFTERIGAEAAFDFLRTLYKPDTSPGSQYSTDFYHYRADLLYHFLPKGRIDPFFAVGLGGATINRDIIGRNNSGSFDYGVGVNFFLNEIMAIRADVRHIIYRDTNTDSNLEYGLGLSVFFGGARPASAVLAEPQPVQEYKSPAAEAPVVAAAPPLEMDSDNDGVVDSLDKCPGTPRGVKVDKDGCPLDSDRDGVPDYLDKCPGTPYGIIVDPAGCPLDFDKDGVPDYLDKCPGTPAGVKVDKNGCPLDSDKDGVPDYLDKCPGTPAGTNVDDKGCPIVEPVQEARAAAAAAVAKEMFEKGRATINIEFDFNKAIVKPIYHQELQKFGDVMKNYPDLKVVIEGHTDNVGGKVINEKLSEKRANSVKNYLVKKFGIAESRLTAKGYGMSKPIDTNKTKAGRQKNRRVEAAVAYTIKK